MRWPSLSECISLLRNNLTENISCWNLLSETEFRHHQFPLSAPRMERVWRVDIKEHRGCFLLQDTNRRAETSAHDLQTLARREFHKNKRSMLKNYFAT